MKHADSSTRDEGLEPTPHRNARGPYVGSPPCAHPIARFAHEPALDALVHELYAGFGPQQWWPAETPFEVAVGAILTQNTAWTNVEHALARLRAAHALEPRALLAASNAQLEEWIRPSGTYRAKTRKLQAWCAWYLARGGLRALREEPLATLRPALLEVHGVGPETADSILCYAAGRPSVVVDAYTRRLLARHGFLRGDEAYERVRAWLTERLLDSRAVYEEFHALCVRVGYRHCKPRARCELCPATTPATPPV